MFTLHIILYLHLARNFSQYLFCLRKLSLKVVVLEVHCKKFSNFKINTRSTLPCILNSFNFRLVSMSKLCMYFHYMYLSSRRYTLLKLKPVLSLSHIKILRVEWGTFATPKMRNPRYIIFQKYNMSK